MGDSYEALIDCKATPSEALLLRPLIIECLVENGLIGPELSADCVLGGLGYPAAAGCAAVFAHLQDDEELPDIAFWTLRTNGVEIHCTPWVNEWGFTSFDGAQCPHCRHEQGEEFLGEVAPLIEEFNQSGTVPAVACSNCGARVGMLDWKCQPHLGFVNLAIVFWNWPTFDSELWKLKVPSLLEAKLGRSLVSTFGNL